MKQFTSLSQWRQSVMLKRIAVVLISLAPLIIAVVVLRNLQAGTTYYVSPNGSNQNSGQEVNLPLANLQHALQLAQAGDTIQLADGEYRENVKSLRDGRRNRPIRIIGSSNAVLRGGQDKRIFEINHSYINLEGFTIDGRKTTDSQPNDPDDYSDKLIYIIGTKVGAGLHDIKILRMQLQYAGGECLRLRYLAHEVEIAYNTIRYCGLYDFQFDGGGKNGEGIYIGTAPEQLSEDKNPDERPDSSYNNWIHDNNIATHGNECVEVKEAAHDNLVENNRCSNQLDPDAGGIALRGDNNIVRGNTITGNEGAGIRLGGDDDNQGINNSVINNVIQNNDGAGLKIMRGPQAEICGNTVGNNQEGELIGDYIEDIIPGESC